MAKTRKATTRPLVVHHDDKDGYTSCGVDYWLWNSKEQKAKLRQTWKSITCKRCLAVKVRLDEEKARKKAWKGVKVGCCV